MRKRCILFLLPIFLFYFPGCQSRQRVTVQLSPSDTVQPQQLYIKAKNYSLADVDTLYHGLFSHLSDQNEYGLLEKHLYFYRKLAGDRRYPRALAAECDGFIESVHTNYDAGLRSFDTAIELYKKINSRIGLTEAYMGKAIIFLSRGAHDSAFYYNYQSLRLYEQIGDSANVYYIKTQIASILIHQRQLSKALPFLQSSMNYYQFHHMVFNEANLEDLLSYAYCDKRQYELALSYALKALASRRLAGKAGDKTNRIAVEEGLSETFNNLATIYDGLGQHEKAIVYYDSSLQLAQQTGHINQIPIIQQNIANAMIAMGKLSEAERLLKQAENSAKVAGRVQVLANISANLSDLYKHKGQYEKALYYYGNYDNYKDSLFSQKRESIINELNIRYETARREAQIAQLHNSARIDAIKKWLYLAALCLVVSISISIILYLQRRNRVQMMLAEKAEAELNANRKELQRFTENILDKNKLIEQMELQLKVHNPTAGMEKDNETLSELYRLKILTEEDWQKFKMLFDKVHPGYIYRLRQQFPSLTPAEERQFLLIKLNIDNKECADMLGISILGVKKNRYRLKKRFNLNEEDNLEQFVRNF